MKNNKLSIWEVSAGDIHKFVLADSMETMKQYFSIGRGGFIRERPDMAITPETEMEILRPKPLPPQKASDFTKLEKAALLLGAGILANSPDWSETERSINWVAVNSVKYAEAILKEANK